MLRQLLADFPRVLAECAVAERLRRMTGVALHPTLYNSPLIYGPESAREAMASIYREYLGIARRSGLPILLTAPTWRLDGSRITAAGVPASIVTDAVAFLMDRRDEVPSDQPPVAIGGLVGPRSDCYRPDLAPSADEAEAFHRPQIEELAGTGIDFLLAQTLPSVVEAAGIARAMSQTGTPFLISFCTGTDGNVLDGTPLPEAMARIDAMFLPESRPAGYFVNCTHPGFLLAAYRPGELARLIGIQANGSSRDVTRLDGSAATVADPVEAWAASMLELHHEHQVPILGGCCGTAGGHLEALAR
jgi:homocysteine S-methyltransferase